MKVNKKCFAIFVNVTSEYISFKITRGRYLGKIKDIGGPPIDTKHTCVFEDTFDSVDYLSAEDIFLTENDAVRKLIKMLSERVKTKGAK